VGKRRGDPNLPENAEYQAGKTEPVINLSELLGGTVKFGAIIVDEDTREKIVGEPEADASRGKISVRASGLLPIWAHSERLRWPKSR
jgi:transcription elongation GreA/GreB family factor